MTTRTAILATVAIGVGAIVLGMGLLFLTVNPRSAGANERASMLGQGVATLCLIPLAIVWILWAKDQRKR